MEIADELEASVRASARVPEGTNDRSAADARIAAVMERHERFARLTPLDQMERIFDEIAAHRAS